MEKIYDRFTANQHALTYNRRGELTKITDLSVPDGSRHLEIGYWRLPADSLFTDGLDGHTNFVFIAGKVRSLRDYTGRDVIFTYNEDGILMHRDGVEVQGANGGFTGRQRTTYVSPDGCGAAAQGIITGNGAQGTGTPLFTVQNTNAAGMVSSGTSAAGPVGYAPPPQNSSKTVENSTATATGPDGSRTKFTFNPDGYAKEIIFQPSLTGGGPGQPEAKFTKEFDTNGLVVRIVYPEGNEVRYTYHTNNASLRARANLVKEEHVPGPRGGPVLTATYAYDGRYMVRSGTMLDFNSNSIIYTPRNDGKEVEKILYPGGAGTHEFSYNNFGQVDLEITPEGIRIDPEYDTVTGFLASRKLGTAPATSFSYFGADRAVQLGMPSLITLPTGAAITQIKYDDRLQVTELTRGSFQEFRAYDTNGNVMLLRRKVDTGDFYEESRSYNQFNFLEKLIVKGVEVNGAAQDLIFAYTPDTSWRVQSITYPAGEVRKFTYNHLGHVTRMEVGQAGQGLYAEDYGRDQHGNLTELKQGGLVTRTFSYDGYDRVVAVTNKAGVVDQTTTFTYHGNGERKRTTVRDSVYGTVADVDVGVDALGRPVTEFRSGDQVTASLSYLYPADAAGGLTQINGPRAGDFAKSLHDSAGRPDVFQNLLVNIDFTPDGSGKIRDAVSSESGTTYTRHFFYNDLDHFERQTDDLGQVTKVEPRVDGAPEVVYDGLNNRTEQDFTRLGEIKEMRRPNGVTFQYEYSAQRLPSKVADKTDKGHGYSYDRTFRPTTTTLRSGQDVSFENPNSLNLPQKVTLPGGGTMDLTYDPQGRILSQSTIFTSNRYNTAQISYDALGRARQISYGDNAQHTASFAFDALGPLTGATFNEQFGSFSVGYNIYEDGAVKSVVYPAPASVSVTEDREVSARLKEVRSGSDSVLRYDTFVGADLPETVSLGGGVIRERNIYDLRKRLLARRYEDANGRLLSDVRYQYDAADNRTARQFVHRHGRADLFSYDSGNRLKHADIGARPEVPNEQPRTLPQFLGAGLRPGFFGRNYLYDDTGGPGSGGLDKLLGVTNINPSAILLAPLPPFAQSINGHDDFLFAVEVDGFTRSRDALGNTTGARLQVRNAGASGPSPVNAILGYNALSQLVSVERSDGVTITYQHQPNGLMHHRTVTQGGATLEDTAFVYDRGRLIAEYLKVGISNILRARYYYADTDSPVAADIRDGAGILKRHYYLKDEQGSVIAVANDQAEVVERIQYDPFGQPIIEARENLPPRVASIVRGVGNELLIQFTERVLPPLAGTAAGTSFVTQTASLANRLTLNTPSGNITGQIIYDEANTASSDFGALVRFQSSASIPTNFTLQVNVGAFVDEWGNSNQTDLVIVTNTGPPGTVLFADPAGAGSTAPVRLARSAIGNPFLFHGQYFDYAAGLLYLRARFYDPYTGHFLQRDPMQYEDSVNLYAGLGFNPASMRDPSGLASAKGGGPRTPSTSNGKVGASYRKTSGTLRQRINLIRAAQARNPKTRQSPDYVASADRRAMAQRMREEAEAAFRAHFHQQAGQGAARDAFESAPTSVDLIDSSMRSRIQSALRSSDDGDPFDEPTVTITMGPLGRGPAPAFPRHDSRIFKTAPVHDRDKIEIETTDGFYFKAYIDDQGYVSVSVHLRNTTTGNYSKFREIGSGSDNYARMFEHWGSRIKGWEGVFVEDNHDAIVEFLARAGYSGRAPPQNVLNQAVTESVTGRQFWAPWAHNQGRSMTVENADFNYIFGFKVRFD